VIIVVETVTTNLEKTSSWLEEKEPEKPVDNCNAEIGQSQQL
jgi:hypothetical protein